MAHGENRVQNAMRKPGKRGGESGTRVASLMDSLDDVPSEASEIEGQQARMLGRLFMDLSATMAELGDRVEAFEQLVTGRGGSWRSISSVIEHLTEAERATLEAALTEAVDASRASSILMYWWERHDMSRAMSGLTDPAFNQDELRDGRRAMRQLQRRLQRSSR
jgi:hypothetical protein